MRILLSNLRLSDALLVGMTGLIDDDGTGENENVVFTVGDLDPVRVGDAEPSFRHGGNHATTASERVFTVEEVAFGFQIVRPPKLSALPSTK
jgi:hypothetical protein